MSDTTEKISKSTHCQSNITYSKMIYQVSVQLRPRPTLIINTDQISRATAKCAMHSISNT